MLLEKLRNATAHATFLSQLSFVPLKRLDGCQKKIVVISD